MLSSLNLFFIFNYNSVLLTQLCSLWVVWPAHPFSSKHVCSGCVFCSKQMAFAFAHGSKWMKVPHLSTWLTSSNIWNLCNCKDRFPLLFLHAYSLALIAGGLVTILCSLIWWGDCGWVVFAYPHQEEFSVSYVLFSVFMTIQYHSE